MPKAKTPRTTSPNKPIVAAPEATSEIKVAGNGASAKSFPGEVETQIRERAYQLYQERGGVPGQENDDWFRAEREVMSRHNHQSV